VSLESNKLKIIDSEIKELENQKKVLFKNIKLQQKTMSKLYDDPEFRDKVAKTQSDIQKKKEEFYNNDEERKMIKVQQAKIIDEMANAQKAKRKLREQKIMLENGMKTREMKRASDKENEIKALKSRMKVWEEIKDKKDNKKKHEIALKEKKCKLIEQEIQEAMKDLQKRSAENEKLSSEVKQLKAMLPKKTMKDSFIEEEQKATPNRDNNDLGLQSKPDSPGGDSIGNRDRYQADSDNDRKLEQDYMPSDDEGAGMEDAAL
jgi:chromosome segregation ATPase